LARIGDTIGSYEITGLLGAGGMAMVYSARHTSIGTEHALKVLLPNYASQPRTVERFRQEARAQFRMRHAHIVQVTDFVDDGDNLALVMDLVQGMTLAEAIRLRPGPWAVADVVAVMRPVLEAMTFAHREGLDGAAVVHRDLKPENILLDLSRERPWPGIPKVADFGIAKVLGASNIATATNARMGTPGYMAPEQARNAKDAGASADVWALGVMLWQLLAGRLPVDPENSLELVKFYEGLTPIPRLTQVVAGVPERLSEVVGQAMALRPEERFQDASPLLRAVEGAVARQDAHEVDRVVDRQARVATITVAVPRRPTEVPTADSRTPIRAFAKENAQVSQTRSSAWWLLLVPVSLALLVVLTAEKKRSEPPKTEVAYPSVVAESGAPPVASPPPLPVPVPEAAPAAQPAPGPAPSRYGVDPTAGIVRDSLTGLVWQRGYSTSPMNWHEAAAYCRGLGLNGAVWRLPTNNELIGLGDPGRRPTIDATVFSTSPDAMRFWSGTGSGKRFWSGTESGKAEMAFFVEYQGGTTEPAALTESYRVRCAQHADRHASIRTEAGLRSKPRSEAKRKANRDGQGEKRVEPAIID
jgi:serine/threonine-protein kinase